MTAARSMTCVTVHAATASMHGHAETNHCTGWEALPSCSQGHRHTFNNGVVGQEAQGA